MYGTPETLSHLLQSDYPADERLLAIVWTADSVRYASGEEKMSTEEAQKILAEIDLRVDLQEDGVTAATVEFMRERLRSEQQQRGVTLQAAQLKIVLELAGQAMKDIINGAEYNEEERVKFLGNELEAMKAAREALDA